MSNPNIDRSIEEFCGNFLSFAVNFSSWGAPTIEIEMLAGSNASLNDSALKSAEKILKNYFPFIDDKNFRLANREIKKSSSGKIISERWVDQFWWYANGKFLGLSGTVGGDLMIGKEYHSVSGVYGQNRKIPKNYTMSDTFLRAHHRDLRTGMCAFESTNGWWKKSCKCSGFSSEKQLNEWRRPPGLENPEITLGEIYYTWPEFLRSSGFQASQISKITNDGTPILTVGNEITNIATGVFNNTGSYYSVINTIVNTFGWTYVPSCALGGHAFINPTGDFGKMDVLTNAGVTVPDNAVASSETRDYSAGYAQGSFLSIKRPGREQDKDIENDQQQTPYTLYCTEAENEPGSTSLITVDVISKVSTYGNTSISGADCIWRFISDLPIFYELGLALWIEENGAPTDGKKETWLKKIYDKAPQDYSFYTNCDGIINVDPIEALRTLWPSPQNYFFGDFTSGTIPQAIEAFQADINVASKVDALIANYNRFAFIREINGDPISISGDVVNPNANGYKKLEEMTAREKFMEATGYRGSQNTFSFSHYGTQRYNFGQKTWSSSGGQVGFLDVSSDNSIGSSPFSDFKQFGFSKITDFLDIYVPQRENSGSDSDSGQDYGIILVDQGPNTVSTFGEGGYGVAGNEVFLDQNPSLEGGLGVVAAIRKSREPGSLLEKAEQLLAEVESVLSENLSGNQPDTSVSWHGVPEDLCFDSRDDESLNDDEESSDEMSREDVNKAAGEYCDAYSREKWEITPKARTLQGKNPNTIHPNKKLHTFNIQWSLANDNQTLYYMDDNGRAQSLAYGNTQAVSVPYLDKISFTLINDFYDLNGKMHLLENVSINVMDGKLTTTYTFSQKVQSPDFAGVFGGKVAFQNLVR